MTVIQLINAFVRTQKKPYQILSESQENRALAKEFASAFYFAMRICHQVVKPNRKTENMRQKTPGIEHGVGVSTGLSGHNLFFLNCCTRRFSLSESALCTAGYFLRNLANVSRESPNRLHMSVIDLSCSSMRTISS